ncbi:MAG: DUF1285 domain-containing protein [Pseudomonadota bacterium]
MHRIIDRIDASELNTEADALPPIHKWSPEITLPSDMHIDAQGTWFHEGGEIKRLPLCQLFASILKKEGDGYVLVTPREKFTLDVDDVPFILVSVSRIEDTLVFRNNLNQVLHLTEANVFELREYEGVQVPYIQVRDDLFARVSRTCFYHLVDMAEPVESNDGTRYQVNSAGTSYELGRH